jgi:hypothetical protein
LSRPTQPPQNQLTVDRAADCHLMIFDGDRRRTPLLTDERANTAALFAGRLLSKVGDDVVERLALYVEDKV